MDQYNHARSCIGHPRLLPQTSMEFTARSEDRKISERAIVLKHGGASYELYLQGYFEENRKLKTNYIFNHDFPNLTKERIESIEKRARKWKPKTFKGGVREQPRSIWGRLFGS